MPYAAASGYAYAGTHGAFSWSGYRMPISAYEQEITRIQSYLARRIDLSHRHLYACHKRHGAWLGCRYGSESDITRARRARDALCALWDESELLFKHAQTMPDAEIEIT